MKNIRLLPMIAAVFVTMSLIVSCGTRRSDDCLTSSLDSLFTTVFPVPEEPGAIVLVAKGDSVVYDRGFGMADLKNGVAICDTTLFNICSISKQFAAMALLRLQEQGKLSIDDNVTKFVPFLTSPQFRKITLRHLMSHTSGIPDTRPRNEEQWRDYLRHHKSQFGSCRDYMLYALTYESTRYMSDLDTFAFEPGTAYEYQNPTYQLMLQIIEDATGERFNPWMQANIFDRAGLGHTLYFDPNVNPDRLSHGYKPAVGANDYHLWRSVDGKWEECDYGEANFFPTKADGGIYTSALDFLKWEHALFGGKVVSDSSLCLATTPVIGTDIPFTSYGLGLFIEEEPGKPRKIFHTGDNGGYLTVEAYFPERDVFYLIFANRPDWDREGTYRKVDKLLADHKLI